MKFSNRLWAWLLVTLAAAAPAARRDEPPKVPVAAENDVVYAKPNGNELKLDLARPA